MFIPVRFKQLAVKVSHTILEGDELLSRCHPSCADAGEMVQGSRGGGVIWNLAATVIWWGSCLDPWNVLSLIWET